MSNAEEDLEYNCPYCMTPISVRVDVTGGRRQAFTIDCENCCRPIEIEAIVESDGTVSIVAKREGEG